MQRFHLKYLIPVTAGSRGQLPAPLFSFVHECACDFAARPEHMLHTLIKSKSNDLLLDRSDKKRYSERYSCVSELEERYR